MQNRSVAGLVIETSPAFSSVSAVISLVEDISASSATPPVLPPLSPSTHPAAPKAETMTTTKSANHFAALAATPSGR
jgi:hypothetical protein